MNNEIRLPYVTVDVDKNEYHFRFDGHYYCKTYDENMNHRALLNAGLIHAGHQLYLKHGRELGLPSVKIWQTEGGYFYYEFEHKGKIYHEMNEGDFDDTLYRGIYKILELACEDGLVQKVQELR